MVSIEKEIKDILKDGESAFVEFKESAVSPQTLTVL